MIFRRFASIVFSLLLIGQAWAQYSAGVDIQQQIDTLDASLASLEALDQRIASVAEADQEALRFRRDERTRIFGRPVDHIYVRGLEAVSADTYNIESSDHNPMDAVLRIGRL